MSQLISGFRNGGFGFISVESTGVVKFCELDLTYFDGEIDDIPLNRYKLGTLGFDLSGNVMPSKTICSYDVGRNNFLFLLCAAASEKCFVQVFINGSRFTEYQYYFYGINITNKKLVLHIPVRMFWYILDIWSRHAFDELMSAFDNLLGGRMSEISDYVDSKSAVLRYWC